MPPRFTPALLALAAEPDALTHEAIWQLLPRPDRIVALTDVLANEQGQVLKSHIAGILTQQRGGFRPATIRKWSPGEMAAAAVNVPMFKTGLAEPLLGALRHFGRPAVQAAFYDALRIAHEDGIPVAPLEPGAIPADRLPAAAERLVARFPDDRSLVYLLIIRVQEPDLWSGLDDWLRRLAALGGVPEGATALPSLPEDPDRLTPLDDLLMASIIDSAAGVGGAPARSSVDAILAEAVELSGRRARTLYHVGLRDGLFGAPASPAQPGEAAERRRWYLAGYLAGLGRRGASGLVLALYEADAEVRGLGDTGTGPSGVAAPVVFGALMAEDRPDLAARFLGRAALVRSDALGAAVLEAGETMLVRGEYATARPLFDPLVEALGERRGAGYAVSAGHWLRARRGRIRCLMHGDSVDEARQELEQLVQEPDRETKAGALVDLGLLAAGYREVGDLRLPAERSALEAVVPRLKRAAQRWAEAMVLMVDGSALALHGTGFMFLVAGVYGDAAMCLEQALPMLEGMPAAAGLVPRARLGLAVAVILELSERQELGRALRLLQQAMGAGERLPAWLAVDVLEALSLSDEDGARAVGEALLGQGGEGVLSAMVATGAARTSRPIADALLERFRSDLRTTPERVSDGHALLPLLRAQGRVEEAGEVLDALEWAAHRGVGAEEFLALLGDPARHEPFWSLEDAGWARIRFLEARRDYAAAAVYLAEEGHRVLSEMPYDALATAGEIVERLGSYGVAGAGLAEELARRVGAGAAALSPSRPPVVPSSRRVRILVVGGAEGEARYDERIRAELALSHPDIEVRFLHSGWTSNWDVHLETFKRELPQVDGVMLLQHMRTEFGRSVRRLCGSVPWRASWAHGQRSIVNGILAVAGVV